MNIAGLLYLFAAICLLLGFLGLIGVFTVGLAWPALFVVAAIFLLIAFFFSGGIGGVGRFR